MGEKKSARRCCSSSRLASAALCSSLPLSLSHWSSLVSFPPVFKFNARPLISAFTPSLAHSPAAAAITALSPPRLCSPLDSAAATAPAVALLSLTPETKRAT